MTGLYVRSAGQVEAAVPLALEAKFDFLVLDGTRGESAQLCDLSAELAGPPDLGILRNTIARLRELNQEEHIDLVYFGGARSGTDAAKVISLGINVVAYGVTAGLALGGEITTEGLHFSAGFSIDERAQNLANILQANAGEASMMARCTGKTRLHNLEPEDLRSITQACETDTAIPLVGHREAVA